MRTTLDFDMKDTRSNGRPSRVVRLLLAMTSPRSHETTDAAEEFPFLDDIRPTRLSHRDLRDSQLIERRLTS